MDKIDPIFYEKGLRFECQGSGKCCTSRGSYGYVYLTSDDRKRFAKYFDLTVTRFTRKFCEKKEGHTYLKNPDSDCSFLRDKRCSVYEARPTQCRTWPFWPENLNPKSWRTDVESFCPGVGKGKTYSKLEIDKIMKSRGAQEA